jgi:ribonuclease P protein component
VSVINSFTKAQRLTKSTDFELVFANTRYKAGSKHLLVLAITNTQSQARMGLVISKKNVGDAVARNRIKRLCRETFRLQCHALPALDIVVLAKPGVSALNNQHIVTQLRQMFDKLTLLVQQRSDSMTPSL